MKKYIQYPLGLLCILLGFGSCDLDELPQDTGSRTAIFGSASGLELYTNSFYEMLPTPYDGVFMIDDNSDLIARNGVDTRFLPNALSPVTSSGWSWGNLRNINYFIENCENSTVAEKDHYLGLARLFRAYFYFGMVKRFGDVPWIDRTIDVKDEATLYGSRDDRFEVMERVLEDLNYAIEHITTITDPSCTKITKDVARAFKTRVCLYEASFRKYHTQYGQQGTANRWFEEVVKTADEIRGFSLHQGDNAYRNLFLQQSPYASETILAVTLDANLQVFSSRNRRTISPTYGNRPALTRRFINTYLNIDGTPFTNDPSYKTTPFTEEVKGRDLRLQQTIRMGNYHRTENGAPIIAPPNLDQAHTGYQIIKGCYDERFPYDDESRNENAHLIFRYAEILLNKAEALAELGTMTDGEWAATIGALRARGGIQGPTLTQKPTVADPYMIEFYKNKFTDPVLLEVLRERAVELITEGLRPDDLIRWRLGELFADAPMNGMYIPALGEYDLNEDGIMDVCFYRGEKPASATAPVFVDVTSEGVGKRGLSEGNSGEILWNPGQREWSDKKYLYPIPEADKIKNPNLGQNPGWE
ncbi:MAG: RagB/SusD family nutrient uptake outer membrane protein [Proteiniphilum sp.]|uniref:RagB/SusD family nutrient uptake outer membrane protein n=1 Tax=Proteiniphilum sp. TaxID=1926877 RepID=UPI002B21C0D3|nr:RagB/SusD family nutrient uptake outer membrane protein [Proteiniphilum sp.]MEA5129988.1 RagB/SusD family nutrient uptake outer membrane protein [Proteiniphilum sp.]